jgi:hypothetical protein
LHESAETHDTACSRLLVSRFGLGETDQVVPFQDWISVLLRPFSVSA